MKAGLEEILTELQDTWQNLNIGGILNYSTLRY